MIAAEEARAWALLLALARRATEGRPVVGNIGLRLDADGQLHETDDHPWLLARPSDRRGWAPATGPHALGGVDALLDLHMPLCVGPGAPHLVIGHLAQSLDGRIATVSGRSQFITCNENLVHAHRLRALCDVLLVGRSTVVEDDPQLNTRLVPGPSPVRAILDPGLRLADDHRIFRDDGRPTLLFCSREAARGVTRHGRAEVIAIDPVDGQLPVPVVLAELRRRGLRRIFIEGGGVTISRFVEARALTRLQVAVAPLLLGSGRATVTLPEIADLSQALVLDVRHFTMGRDLLFDCVFAVS